MSHVDIVFVGVARSADDWPLGVVHGCADSPQPLDRLVRDALVATTAQAILFWDSSFPLPAPAVVEGLLDGSGDVWHAGLLLGQLGRPAMIDYVAPTWMLNRDPEPTIEATSWRLSLRATLIRVDVLRSLGGPSERFDTLSGASLDLGLRVVRGGAIPRHVPRLLPLLETPASFAPPPTARDELRIVVRSFGRKWGAWALHRGLLTRRLRLRSLPTLIRTWNGETPPASTHARRAQSDGTSLATLQEASSVSVLIPTIDRYPYLETMLEQLARQSIPPREVIVVDQTPLDRRRHDLEEAFPDLPLQVIQLPEPGQCTSRNAGLRALRGEQVLFLDDDDEVADDLVESHLRRLIPTGIDASCGGVDERDSGPPPVEFRHRQVSGVFPTNNTMLRVAALRSSGLFDPAFDRGARADHDLGMRLYLSGALLMFDPDVRVFHHRAPQGGLRTHGARRTTRATSRRTLSGRDLPSVTQFYLHMRYFSPVQCRESERVLILSKLTGEGPTGQRALRALVQVVLLPDTVRRVRGAREAAEDLLARRPPIPTLGSALEHERR